MDNKLLTFACVGTLMMSGAFAQQALLVKHLNSGPSKLKVYEVASNLDLRDNDRNTVRNVKLYQSQQPQHRGLKAYAVSQSDFDFTGDHAGQVAILKSGHGKAAYVIQNADGDFSRPGYITSDNIGKVALVKSGNAKKAFVLQNTDFGPGILTAE